MKSVGELRNEIAEHVACSWKAVQQKECRSVRATRLPVEDFDAVDRRSPISDLSWGCSQLYFFWRHQLVIPRLGHRHAGKTSGGNRGRHHQQHNVFHEALLSDWRARARRKNDALTGNVSGIGAARTQTHLDSSGPIIVAPRRASFVRKNRFTSVVVGES